MIYQFYYGPESSDTFGYYKASNDIWNTFIYSPLLAFKILISKAGTYDPETYPYIVDMWGIYRNPHTFFVARIGGIIGLFTFGTFTPITIVMAFFAFLASWKFYELFVELYPENYQNLAIAILFLPSVFFWGSGLFKDTITFGSLAMLTYASYYIFIKKKQSLILWIILFISIYTIVQIKVYIILCFLFPLIIWIALAYKKLDKLPWTIEQENKNWDKIDQNLIFIGFVTLKDPLRPDAKETITLCRRAGIRPIIITGDHPLTAFAIAKEVGFTDSVEKIITGNKLDKINDEELNKNIENIKAGKYRFLFDEDDKFLKNSMELKKLN